MEQAQSQDSVLDAPLVHGGPGLCTLEKPLLYGLCANLSNLLGVKLLAAASGPLVPGSQSVQCVLSALECHPVGFPP